MSTSQTMLPRTPFLIPLKSKCAMSRGYIYQTMLRRVLVLVQLESPQWGGLMMFRLMVQELLNIE
jgi:hypothetical protein